MAGSSKKGFPGYWTKLKEGKYKLTIDLGHDFTGKRIRPSKTVYVDSDRKADKALLAYWNENKDKQVVSYDGKMTVSSLADKYIELLSAKKATISSYKKIIRLSIKPLLGKHEIEKVTPLHIQEWVKHLEKKGNKDGGPLAPKTVACRLSVLNEMFDAAVGWKLLKENPCINIKPPTIIRSEADYYTREEVAEILERVLKLDDDKHLTFKTGIVVELFSGLRKGELYGLKWSNINLETGEIKIDSARIYATGFGSYEDTPKSESGNRDIVLPELCRILLRKLKVQQAERKLLLGERWGPDDGLVMLNPQTGLPLGVNRLYNWFVALLDDEGIRRAKRAIHALRHTNVSMIHSLNPNLTEISKWIGHSKTSTTLNIYTHLFKDDSKKDIADKLDKAFATFLPPQEKTNA